MGIERRMYVRVAAIASVLAFFVVSGCGGDTGGSDDGDTGAVGTDTGGGDLGEPDTAEGRPDAGGEDTGMATDTGEAGETGMPDGDDGGMEQALAVVMSTNDTEAEESTVHVSVEPFSGGVVDEKSYDTKQLVLDSSGGELFALNRRCSGFGEQEGCPHDFGLVEGLQIADDGTIAADGTYQLPEGVYNPYGAGFVESEGRTFVTSYFESSTYAFEGVGEPVDTLDVSQFDTGGTEMDDDPEASDVAVEGDYVYFVLQRLSGYDAEENSVVAGYDASAGEFLDMDEGTEGVQALDLEGTNANAGLDRTPGGGWTAALTGSFGEDALDGKIVGLEWNEDGTLSVGDVLVDEETLDGNITNYRMVGERSGVVSVVQGQDARFVRFDENGFGEVLREPAAFTQTICASPDRQQVWLGEPTESGAAFIGYDTSTWEELEGGTIEIDGAGVPTSCRVVRTGN